MIPEPEFANLAIPPDYTKTLAEFRKSYPSALSMDQSAVIEIGFKKIATLGLCSYNSYNGDISLALMTTTGMKLIEIEKKSKKIKTRFLIHELSNKKNAGKQLVEDVKIIYCHPSSDYNFCELRKNSLTYGWTDSKNRTELIFGKKADADDIELLVKKIYFDNSPVSIVYYHEYKLINGKNVPVKISYFNKKFNYSLLLKTLKVF